jgi:hypothetical protein
MTCATISSYSGGPKIALSGRITSRSYVVGPKVQFFPLTMMQFFKMTIRPYTQPAEFSLALRNTKMHFNIFPGQHNRQT